MRLACRRIDEEASSRQRRKKASSRLSPRMKGPWVATTRAGTPLRTSGMVSSISGEPTGYSKVSTGTLPRYLLPQGSAGTMESVVKERRVVSGGWAWTMALA